MQGAQITVRCVTPVVGDEGKTFPVYVYIHGGGKALTVCGGWSRLMTCGYVQADASEASSWTTTISVVSVSSCKSSP